VERLAFLLLGLVAAAPASNAPQREKPRSATEQLHELLDAEWEWQLSQEPTFSTRIGERRYNDRWADLSLDAIARRRLHSEEVLAKARSLDRTQLSSADQLNYDLFSLDARLAVEGNRFHAEYLPISPRQGVHQEVAELIHLTPLSTVKDYEDLIKRLTAFPKLVEQTMVLMRKGLETGITPPKVILRQVGQQMSNQIFSDPTRSPVYQQAFAHFPPSIDQASQARLQEEGKRAIQEAVIPAIRNLRSFVLKEYEPKARSSIALSALPEGPAWYAHRIKVMTTTDLSAEEIHQLGLSEVKRIRAEMEGAMRQVHFQRGLSAFFEFLRTDPRFFFKDRDQLLIAYRDIAKRIDPELPRLFRTLPRMPYGVIPVPSYSEKTQTTAYYQPGSLDAGRAGYFYANTYDLKSRPKWEMEALTLHEAMPGHHLQIALAQELSDVPKFRRFGGYTAFVEGWGLYSESLGAQMGFYKDPYSKFGQLTYEMWRAIRLVVDTGMHAKGWTREQAIAFFQQNTGKALHDIEVEIDRYIAWPAQALAYKLGELKIKELRSAASRQLGDQFDLREFHDQLLGAGPLPLSLLEGRVQQWVAEKAAKSKQSAIN
jgi:uncharacterized protein (DUF885 family)